MPLPNACDAAFALSALRFTCARKNFQLYSFARISRSSRVSRSRCALPLAPAACAESNVAPMRSSTLWWTLSATSSCDCRHSSIRYREACARAACSSAGVRFRTGVATAPLDIGVEVGGTRSRSNAAYSGDTAVGTGCMSARSCIRACNIVTEWNDGCVSFWNWFVPNSHCVGDRSGSLLVSSSGEAQLSAAEAADGHLATFTADGLGPAWSLLGIADWAGVCPKAEPANATSAQTANRAECMASCVNCRTARRFHRRLHIWAAGSQMQQRVG